MDILIIDDTNSDHDLIAKYLEDTSHAIQFHHAYSAADGLRLLKQQQYDCVLLDYHLPDANGLEVLKQLAASEPRIPVIMITGDGNEFIAVSAMKLGAEDYLPKNTLSASALKRAVERAVDRSQILQCMEAYRKQLEISNQDLEQFATIVAHDLKAPLRAITQHLTLIGNRSGALLDEKSKRSFDFAIEGASRMRHLIEALFEYARLGFTEPELETVWLEDVLAQTLVDIDVLVQERHAEITHDALPAIKGDRVLITQLLQNLLCNAIKFCHQTPRIHISAIQCQEQWQLNIQDNGIGISPSQQEKIFCIFRRLHAEQEYPGIGLGLAVCDRIAKQHGGSIRVTSETDKGSCFMVTLPAANIVPQAEMQAAYG